MLTKSLKFFHKFVEIVIEDGHYIDSNIGEISNSVGHQINLNTIVLSVKKKKKSYEM